MIEELVTSATLISEVIENNDATEMMQKKALSIF